MTRKTLDLETAESLIAGTESVACPKCGESSWSKAQPTKQTSKPGFLTVRCKVCANKASLVTNNKRYATDEAFREAKKACSKERYANDTDFREAQKAYHKDLYANDPVYREYKSAYHKDRYANDEEFREAEKARSLQWKKENPGKHNAKNAKYRATKKQATPAWSETDLIQEFYVNCPEGMHVDHIVPLTPPTDENGKEIGCGLHVLKNLQYLTAAENLSKSNKWPESLLDWTYPQP